MNLPKKCAIRRRLSNALIAAFVCSGMLWPDGLRPRSVPDESAALAANDRALVAALLEMNRDAARRFLDPNFLWTDANGATLGRSMVLGRVPRSPLGDESGAQKTERVYGQVGVVQVSRGKMHVLRVWVLRPQGWRALIYQEVEQRETPAPPPEATTNVCDDPCKSVPYAPQDDAERGILASWAALETAVTNHDPRAWAPHFLGEFVLISSNATEPADKARRIAQLSRPGIGPAPPQLAADPPAQFFHFGTSVVMVSRSRPYSGRAAHITRLWVYRDGLWRMAFSYQTTVEAAPFLHPPKMKTTARRR